MATPAQIEEQVNFEREAIKQGLERLRKNTKDLEDKSYASATVYGCSSISTLLPLVTKRIEDTNLRIRKGCIGKSFKEIHQYLEPIDPGAAAAIALKITFDKVFSYKDKVIYFSLYVSLLVQLLSRKHRCSSMKRTVLVY